MKKVFALFIITMCLAVTIAFSAKPRKVIGAGEGTSHFREPYHQSGSVTLSSDTVYILSGWYFVDSTASITIQPGTLILGDTASAATLIIKRGAQIHATGTAQAPIILTSSKPVGRKTPGDWGGVIILGQAPTNQPTDTQIEGGFGSVGVPNSYTGYGGTVGNDNSGEFQYVRIEFAGIAFALNNESNGLTMGGVGSGTTINHVQVSFGQDDDYEFFGGSVRAKYLVSWRGVDDCFDTDFGYSGKLQHLYTKRDPNIFDAANAGGSNGPESDNMGNGPYLGWPKTNARLSNWTLVGPASDTNTVLDSHWGRLGLLRRNSALCIYNSVMYGWQNGISLTDTVTHYNAINDSLQLRHLSIASKYPGISKSPATGTPQFNIISWFETAAWGNIGSTGRQHTAIGLPAEVFNLNSTNNPVPSTGSEPATAGTGYDGFLSGDTWFDQVTYRGAFVPGQAMSSQWTAGWTNFEPENTHYEDLGSGWNLVSLPAAVSNTDPDVVFAGKSGTMYKYNTATKGYETEETAMEYGRGYWVNYPSVATLQITGSAIGSASTIAAQAGWVLVGSDEKTIPVSSLILSGGATINGNAWKYNPVSKGYDQTSNIAAGTAVWINVSAACTITIPN